MHSWEQLVQTCVEELDTSEHVYTYVQGCTEKRLFQILNEHGSEPYLFTGVELDLDTTWDEIMKPLACAAISKHIDTLIFDKVVEMPFGDYVIAVDKAFEAMGDDWYKATEFIEGFDDDELTITADCHESGETPRKCAEALMGVLCNPEEDVLCKG